MTHAPCVHWTMMLSTRQSPIAQAEPSQAAAMVGQPSVICGVAPGVTCQLCPFQCKRRAT